MQLRRLTLLFVASALVLAGCGDSAPSWKGGGGSTAAAATVKVTGPADGAKDVSTATSVTDEASSADATVTLQDAAGGTVEGAPAPSTGASPAPGGAEWMPAKQLKWGTEYTATVTAGGAKSTVKFTTMAKPS